MNQALAFVDLLGFSNMVEKDHIKAREILNDFYNISFDIIKSEPLVKGMLVSDSLIAYSDNKITLINLICNIYRKCLRKNLHYENSEHFFLLPRGGVSIGIVNIEERNAAPNLTKII